MFAQINFMYAALEQAKKAFEKDFVPIGCVITHNNEIITRAHNQEFWHAEIICIQLAQEKLGKYLDDTKIFITVEPCAMCLHAIKLARINSIIFGAPNSNEPIPQPQIIGHICETSSALLMQKFFEKKRK